MSNLYTLLESTHHQFKSSLSSLLAANNSTACDVSKKHLYQKRLATREYELHEPSPDEKNEITSNDRIINMKLLLNEVTTLCNDLDELIALHYCFYEAAEAVFDKEYRSHSKEGSANNSLSLFPYWLRERDLTVLDTMHMLQHSMREICQDD